VKSAEKVEAVRGVHFASAGYHPRVGRVGE